MGKCCSTKNINTKHYEGLNQHNHINSNPLNKPKMKELINSKLKFYNSFLNNQDNEFKNKIEILSKKYSFVFINIEELWNEFTYIKQSQKEYCCDFGNSDFLLWCVNNLSQELNSLSAISLNIDDNNNNKAKIIDSKKSNKNSDPINESFLEEKSNYFEISEKYNNNLTIKNSVELEMQCVMNILKRMPMINYDISELRNKQYWINFSRYIKNKKILLFIKDLSTEEFETILEDYTTKLKLFSATYNKNNEYYNNNGNTDNVKIQRLNENKIYKRNELIKKFLADKISISDINRINKDNNNTDPVLYIVCFNYSQLRKEVRDFNNNFNLKQMNINKDKDKNKSNENYDFHSVSKVSNVYSCLKALDFLYINNKNFDVFENKDNIKPEKNEYFMKTNDNCIPSNINNNKIKVPYILFNMENYIENNRSIIFVDFIDKHNEDHDYKKCYHSVYHNFINVINKSPATYNIKTTNIVELLEIKEVELKILYNKIIDSIKSNNNILILLDCLIGLKEFISLYKRILINTVFDGTIDKSVINKINISVNYNNRLFTRFLNDSEDKCFINKTTIYSIEQFIEI